MQTKEAQGLSSWEEVSFTGLLTPSLMELKERVHPFIPEHTQDSPRELPEYLGEALTALPGTYSSAGKGQEPPKCVCASIPCPQHRIPET